jgi:hypothetical protein
MEHDQRNSSYHKTFCAILQMWDFHIEISLFQWQQKLAFKTEDEKYDKFWKMMIISSISSSSSSSSTSSTITNKKKTAITTLI